MKTIREEIAAVKVRARVLRAAVLPPGDPLQQDGVLPAATPTAEQFAELLDLVAILAEIIEHQDAMRRIEGSGGSGWGGK